MTALTKAHMHKLNDEDVRTIALRIVADAVSALDPSTEAHDLTNHPDLDPAPVHDAADWLHEILTNPDDRHDHDTWKRHRDAVRVFCKAAYGIGESTTGNGYAFPPHLNAGAVRTILNSVIDGGTPHRPSAGHLHAALTDNRGVFIPGHETGVGYALKALCTTDDPRLPALAETYLQSGLHTTLLDAIDEATQQLARLDELADLNR